jgi:hypothetical protein
MQLVISSSNSISLNSCLRAPDAPPVIFLASMPCKIIIPLAEELRERAV